ncbi:MAG TPA: sulfotransferase [Woeseiaceae bacterium]|nr:sulfotransferase [Woeseiaceae bacterium]
MKGSDRSTGLAANVEYPFDRPVILLAAPRSGSTLLFETLAKSQDFWTIGGESHAIFESIRQFSPQSGICDSNALYAADATAEVIAQIRASFLDQLRNAQGIRYRGAPDHAAPRFLEKTPKNAVRVSLLNEIFPDALFVYLYRNPRENISSMIDAWHSGRFVTYRRLPGRNAPWSLLLPPGWQQHHASSIAQIAAFQWRAANTAILQELAKVGADRWTAVSYGQQVHAPIETVRRLCRFCDVSADGIVASLSEHGLKPSRYTLTKPEPDKWQKNAQALLDVLPGLAETVRFIRELAPGLPEEEFDLRIDPELTAPGRDMAVEGHGAELETVRRNERCHCGSGKRFKHCHGDPRLAGAAR